MANDITFNFIFDSILEDIGIRAPHNRASAILKKKLADHKRVISSRYNEIKTHVKNAYMEDPSACLDRHKCASSFMVALLEKFPISGDALIEERFAIYVGMLILKIFIYKECKDHGDLSLIDFINKNNGLRFPKCVCDNEPYKHNLALVIHYDRTRENGILSVLALSNILFLIEKHNRMIVAGASIE